MNAHWKHKTTIYDGEKFEISGLNIWDFKWQTTKEKININDPLYGQSYLFDVYKIQNLNIEVLFAAGEFSNCVWRIYLNEDNN
jgi:hypothetical protein